MKLRSYLAQFGVWMGLMLRKIKTAMTWHQSAGWFCKALNQSTRIHQAWNLSKISDNQASEAHWLLLRKLSAIHHAQGISGCVFGSSQAWQGYLAYLVFAFSTSLSICPFVHCPRYLWWSLLRPWRCSWCLPNAAEAPINRPLLVFSFHHGLFCMS